MSPSGEPPRIDGERLWRSLMASARIGAGPAGGLRRLALGDADRRMRETFVDWCEAAGLAVRVDRMGNVFARRPGREDDLPPVLMGSHLDTQAAGGRFDGVLGVLGGLEVVRTLNDHGLATRRPIELVDWTNEEGARFPPPMLASGVFAGVHDLDWALARTDDDGITVAEALERTGFAGAAPVGGRPPDAYFELHIEQGPELEAAGAAIGVVTGAYATRAMHVDVRGETAHAGPTPMAERRNALIGAARLAVAVDEVGRRYAPEGKATAARLVLWPNKAGILPSYAQLTVDVRHPDAATADAMMAEVAAAMPRAAEAANVALEAAERWRFGEVPFDAECIELVRRAADDLGLERRDMASQAGHDAYHLARVAPTAMIFVPHRGGITHNEAEDMRPEEAARGADVLLRAVLARAER